MTEIINLITNNGLALVGVAVIYYDMRKTQQEERKESLERELRLMEEINGNRNVLTQMSESLLLIKNEILELKEGK